MAESRLTVRTLCLATIGLVLACGHAARAMSQQRPADRPATKATGVIRVVPAGSGHSTIATHTNSSSGTRGGSRVATFTSKSGSGSSVVTFAGDRVMQRASAAPRKTQPKAVRKTPGLLERKEPPVIAVRRNGAHAEQTEQQASPIEVAAASEQPRPARAGLRNAFGGLTSSTVMDSAGSARVYAQAPAR